LNDKDSSIVTPALSHKPTGIARPNELFIGLMRNQRNYLDCAMAPLLDVNSPQMKPHFRAARVAAGNGNSGGIQDLTAPGSPIGVPDRGQRVRKDGATTGLTSGTVVDVNADFYVEYSFGTFLFGDQVVIEGDDDAFAGDGDSGSIVIDPDKKQAIAMIFAESGRFAIACSLACVLRQLKDKANASDLSLVSD